MEANTLLDEERVRAQSGDGSADADGDADGEQDAVYDDTFDSLRVPHVEWIKSGTGDGSRWLSGQPIPPR